MIDLAKITAGQELGERLRLAREKCDLTQANAARLVKLARTTLVAIEQGKREPTDRELIALTDQYGVTLNELLRKEAIHVDLIPRFRKMVDQDGEGIAEAANILNTLVAAEIELERVLGIEHASNLPAEKSLKSGDVRKQAEDDAHELREWIGLGSNPIRDIFSLLEMDLGIRVFSKPLPSKIAGLFAYDKEVGACILINSRHPYERQIQSAAHETGHVIATRQRPDIFSEGKLRNSREERYATSFAPAFLMPKKTVEKKFLEVTAGAKNLTRRHIVLIAHYFGVSREALGRRLEDLSLVPEGSWDWFVRNGGISNAQAESVLGEARIHNIERYSISNSTSIRIESLAAQALERELMTEGQISQLLMIDRMKVRRLVDLSGSGPNDFG